MRGWRHNRGRIDCNVFIICSSPEWATEAETLAHGLFVMFLWRSGLPSAYLG